MAEFPGSTHKEGTSTGRWSVSQSLQRSGKNDDPDHMMVISSIRQSIRLLIGRLLVRVQYGQQAHVRRGNPTSRGMNSDSYAYMVQRTRRLTTDQQMGVQFLLWARRGLRHRYLA